jgi:hypothetical protein
MVTVHVAELFDESVPGEHDNAVTVGGMTGGATEIDPPEPVTATDNPEADAPRALVTPTVALAAVADSVN